MFACPLRTRCARCIGSVLGGFLLSAGGTSACWADPIVFVCRDDTQCSRPDAPSGSCVDPGYCAFPDAVCESRLRYSDHAGDGLASACVPALPGSESGAIDTDFAPNPTTTATTTTDETSGPGTSSTSGGSTGGSSSGCVLSLLEIPADLATCTAPDLLDPQACEAAAGTDQFLIDTEHIDLTGAPLTGFLRFTLPELQGVISVAARLEVSDNGGSDGSGEMWEVETFEEGDLSMFQPEKLNREPLAGDPGPAGVGDQLYWSLPPEIVLDRDVLALGLFATSSDAQRFWTDRAAEGFPALIVEACQ